MAMSTSTSKQPLSLEDRCLLHLITHLEKYPFEALASLPLHLRHRLLLNLPAVDICQLEDTAVTQGIDVENSVWKKFQHEDLSKSESSVRKAFFVWMLGHLFRGHIQTVVHNLFPIHGPYRDRFPPVGCYPTGVPPRHIHKSPTEEILEMQLLSALVNQCKIDLPESVLIFCDGFARTQLWKKQNTVSQNFLSSLLCEIKSLSFDGYSRKPDCLSIPRSILELIFSRPTTTLTSLSIDGHVDFVLLAVADVELFFAPPRFSEDKNCLQSLYPQLPSCPLPYSNLTSISIGSGGCVGLLPREDSALHEHLTSIVLNQTALESLTFHSGLTPNAFNLYATLGRLFYQPQFRALSVEYGDLDWKRISALVLPFLSSPICTGRKQELHLIDNCFILDWPAASLEFDGRSVLPGKVLSFEETSYQGNLKFFLQWLSNSSIPGLLISFNFFNDNDKADRQEVFDTAMSLLRRKSSAAMLESFLIRDVPLFLERSQIPFNYLFSAQHLKKVSLCHCGIFRNNLLPVLTQALLKQVPLGVLEDLSLDSNGLDSSSDEEFKDFADTIFHLPQLTKLKLSLQDNDLKSRHFTVLYEAWRSFSRGQIDSLDIEGNDYEDLQSLLLQVAAKGDFTKTD